MKQVIQIAESDDARAWAILQRHSQGVALPNRTFIVSDEAVNALRQAGLHVTVLSQDSRAFTEEEEGVSSGERI